MMKNKPADEFKPVANSSQIDASDDDFLGRLHGIVIFSGDIESPVEPAESWKVLR